MTKVIMRKHGASFVPDEEEAAEVLARIPEGACVVVEARQPRSLDQLRKWWKMMSILADNMPVIVDKRAASDLVLIACHECDWRVDPRSLAATPIPRSINFESMDEDAFKRLWERAKHYINSEWLPIGTAKLEAEIADFFAGAEARSLGRRVVTRKAA